MSIPANSSDCCPTQGKPQVHSDDGLIDVGKGTTSFNKVAVEMTLRTLWGPKTWVMKIEVDVETEATMVWRWIQ